MLERFQVKLLTRARAPRFSAQYLLNGRRARRYDGLSRSRCSCASPQGSARDL